MNHPSNVNFHTQYQKLINFTFPRQKKRRWIQGQAQLRRSRFRRSWRRIRWTRIWRRIRGPGGWLPLRGRERRQRAGAGLQRRQLRRESRRRADAGLPVRPERNQRLGGSVVRPELRLRRLQNQRRSVGHNQLGQQRRHQGRKQRRLHHWTKRTEDPIQWLNTKSLFLADND